MSIIIRTEEGSIVSDVIVLLHGSANGSHSWGPVERTLVSRGAMVVAPDMLGYGHAHPPSEVWNLDEETEHLKRSLEPVHGEPIHLVAHSLGATFGLYLLRALGPRVARMTLIDPVVVSVLRHTGEDDGYAEMEEQYQRFMGLLPDPAAAARAFVEHWSGTGRHDEAARSGRVAAPNRDSGRRTDARCAACDCPPACSCIQRSNHGGSGCGPHDSADAPSGRRRRHPRVMTTER